MLMQRISQLRTFISIGDIFVAVQNRLYHSITTRCDYEGKITVKSRATKIFFIDFKNKLGDKISHVIQLCQ